MNILFSGKFASNPETFGINFEATVDGQRVVCCITLDALQDVDPSNSQATPEQQFLANRCSFEAIAKQKILSGDTGPVEITSADVRS